MECLKGQARKNRFARKCYQQTVCSKRVQLYLLCGYSECGRNNLGHPPQFLLANQDQKCFPGRVASFSIFFYVSISACMIDSSCAHFVSSLTDSLLLWNREHLFFVILNYFDLMNVVFYLASCTSPLWRNLLQLYQKILLFYTPLNSDNNFLFFHFTAPPS